MSSIERSFTFGGEKKGPVLATFHAEKTRIIRFATTPLNASANDLHESRPNAFTLSWISSNIVDRRLALPNSMISVPRSVTDCRFVQTKPLFFSWGEVWISYTRIPRRNILRMKTYFSAYLHNTLKCNLHKMHANELLTFKLTNFLCSHTHNRLN